ncbi:MAG: serine/threonine protein kinase, partial [Kiritimatiellae bacterium]|nr:serine/threonine protein kinase [Kiritimatiellia bacterium]
MSEQLISTPSTFGENGNFLLERELGAGGMGGVYMGRDKMLDRPVAVKVMLRELGSDAEFVEKFKREAQAAARLIHPNIAQVYSYGIADGMPYIAMELASGGSLYSIMTANPGKTDIPRVIKICQQVAMALQCASDQGCVHGDVKPENVLLDANGNAKLVDFGLAAMQRDTNEIWGTPYYISPEKVKKEPIDFRADMYSLGGTLYHALTGVAPFEGDDSIAVVKRRFEGMPRKPSEIRPEITPAIDALVMKMLAFKKEDRYPSFEALLEAFKDVLTTGLTRKEPRPEGIGASKGGVGVRRPVRGRRPMVMRPGGQTAQKGDQGVDDIGEAADRKPTKEDDSDEEEGGGNLAAKVVGVIVGVIALVGIVIGGLVWYQVSNRRAQEAELIAQITGGIEKARSAIRSTVASAQKFADEFDAFAAKAVAEVEKPTEELKKMLSKEEAALLKPAPSKELLDAIAATNGTQQAAAPAPAAATNATPPAAKAPKAEAKAASTNAAPAAAGATNAAQAKAA